MRDKLGRFIKGHPQFNTGKTWFKKNDKRLTGNQYAKGNLPNKTSFKKGQRPHNYKGRVVDFYGYILIHKPNHPFATTKDGYVRESRLIVESQIERYLTLKEVTHHLGAKDDNRPHRLMAFKNQATHNRFEHNINIRQEDIIFDGRKL